MTNIIWTVILSLTTNWTTQSIIVPGDSLQYSGEVTEHQVGAIIETRTMEFEYEGQTHRVTLGSQPVGQVERDVKVFKAPPTSTINLWPQIGTMTNFSYPILQL